MARNYTKEPIIQMLHEINNDCEDCLSMYIKGCLNKDEHMSFAAKENWFNKLTPIQQTISCLIDFMKE